MKRTIFLLIGLTMAFVQAKADLAPTVMLHHNGQAKYYMYYQIQNAVDDAVDGDTIYLSEGTFQPFNINKRIMVRGAGSTTLIEGDCEINISGTAKLTMPVLDAVSFNGSVTVKSAYKQFTLRKCKMQNLIWDTNNEFWDTKVEQCIFTNRLNLPNNVKEFNAFNSIIWIFYPYDYAQGHATFEHCNIASILAPIVGGVFNSCAIGPNSKLSGAENDINLIGCVLNSCYYSGYASMSNCNPYNCYVLSKSNAYSSDKNFFYNYDASQSNYQYSSALDGTKIGAYGGQHPITLRPEVPGVTQYKMSIDSATKTMKVKLTVDKLVK